MSDPEGLYPGGDVRNTKWIPRRFLVVLALVCELHGGCGSLPAPLFVSRAPADRMIQEDDIREAVFRYRISSKNPDSRVFLRIDGKDPSDTFMARFADLNPPIEKASRAHLQSAWLRDGFTGEQAVELSVGSISWISVHRVELPGRSYCGIRCADVGIYRVVKQNGHWAAKQYEVKAIS
jgi:hypothetical protein